MGRLMKKKEAETLLKKELKKIDLEHLITAIINYNHACGKTETDDICELALAMIKAAEESIDVLWRHIYYNE